MARYSGPRLKLMRAVGIQLPGLSRKGIERRPYPPGMHGSQQNRKKSNFGTQLREKQKLRFNYCITEKYLRRIVQLAFRSKTHSGHKLLELLESRLDNIVFRAGYAPTILAARQLVSHNHILVDNKSVNIASYRVKPGQILTLKEKSKKNAHILASLEQPSLSRPAWLSYDEQKQQATMIAPPDRESFPFPIEISLVVEFYARSVR